MNITSFYIDQDHFSTQPWDPFRPCVFKKCECLPFKCADMLLRTLKIEAMSRRWSEMYKSACETMCIQCNLKCKFSYWFCDDLFQHFPAWKLLHKKWTAHKALLCSLLLFLIFLVFFSTINKKKIYKENKMPLYLKLLSCPACLSFHFFYLSAPYPHFRTYIRIPYK